MFGGTGAKVSVWLMFFKPWLVFSIFFSSMIHIFQFFQSEQIAGRSNKRSKQVYFRTAFLSCNSHTTQFARDSVRCRGSDVFGDTCDHHRTRLEIFHHLRRKARHSAVTTTFPITLGGRPSTFRAWAFALLSISYQWDPTLGSLLHQASSTEKNGFKVRPCCGLCEHLIPF